MKFLELSSSDIIQYFLRNLQSIEVLILILCWLLLISYTYGKSIDTKYLFNAPVQRNKIKIK
jgi:hypothetical protein